MYDPGFEAGTANQARDGEVRETKAPGWRGAGGRWLVWLFRVVLWGVLLLIGYRGVAAIVLGETATGQPSTGGPASGTSFPMTLAGAYALEFGHVYLNADPSTQGTRANELAAFLPPGTDPSLGYNGSGTLQLQSEEVAGVQVRDAHHAVVTLLARVNGHLMELGVPMYAAHGGLVVSGEPAWLPAPTRVLPPQPAQPVTDTATQTQLMNQLPAFFQAYADGNQVTLGRFLAPGTKLAGLAGAVTFGSLTSVTVPEGGTTRQVIATVVWHVPGAPAAVGQQTRGAPPPAGLEMSYQLTIVKRSGTWYVKQISPSTQAAGSP